MMGRCKITCGALLVIILCYHVACGSSVALPDGVSGNGDPAQVSHL